jgi:hypothetical protein
MLPFFRPHQHSAPQGRLGQIKGFSTLVFYDLPRLLLPLTCRYMPQVDYRQLHIAEFPNDLLLKPFLLVHHKTGPQLFMPSYHLPQSPLQREDIQVAYEFPGQRHVVEVAARLELVEKPKLLLLVRKRKNRGS